VNVQVILTLTGDAVILATAVPGYLSLRGRGEKTHRLAQKTEKLVNNQLDRQLSYNGQLASALTDAGQPVPEQDPPPGAAPASP
jgi:hypothetical protein